MWAVCSSIRAGLKRTPITSLLTRTLSTGAVAETDTEVLVVGAGVIGLAIARQLASAGRDVLIIDAAQRFGSEISSRSSEVIHAGIYYPKNSLKAQLCVEGKQLMYEYCTQREVPHRRLGKLIVATTEAQIPALRKLQKNSAINGVDDLKWLTSEQVRALEPNIFCLSAVLSPSTGIVDSHSLMAALLEDFESSGGIVALNSKFERGIVGKKNKNGIFTTVVRDVGGGEETSITSRFIVNAAGLHAQKVASTLEGLPRESIPELFLAKGTYFVYSPSISQIQTTTTTTITPSPPPLLSPRVFKFNHLVYPIPEPGTAGLGVHLTLDLSGGIRFGPDVQYLPSRTNPDEINYAVDPGRGSFFEAAARSFFPDLPQGSLVPGYSGVRPKVVGPGYPAADFIVAGPAVHGVAGLVNLFGIESPGLTSSLALAKLVERELS
jgi:L-2-hydroxyglutarate oxidase LhgO